MQFLFWNWASLKSLSLSDTLTAFIYGARFDLSALAASIGLGILGAVWIERKWLRRGWFFIFFLINSSLIVLNLGDSELINFTARRFTKSSFFLLSDGSANNLILPYLGMTVFTLLLLSAYAVYTIKIARIKLLKRTPTKKAFISLAVVIIAVLCSRGGFQVKPLTYVDAKIFESSFANNLILNSSFTLIKSLDRSPFERIHYFENTKMLSLLNEQNLPSQIVSTQQKKMNVVLVIVESLSKEYTEVKNPEATPFFNKMKARGISFDQAYANSRRSIEGIAALLSGIPALMEEPFINSEFSANQVIGLGAILEANSYHTSFFHGAKNGSMHFDQFMKSIGVSHYYGKTEYGATTEDDGTWGIYDEPFLQWMCQKLNTFKAPFFSSVFTLSSHHPYRIPDQYKVKFSQHQKPLLNSVEYTDYAIEQFMACAEKQAWYHDTLFIFTADHTGVELNINSDFESLFKIPLLFFHPNSEVLKPMKNDQYAQHIDVLPTLLETLGIPQKNVNYLARSLWKSGPKVVALYSDRKYQLVGEVTKQEDQLKAIQQYFSEGLYDNRLYYPAK
ncbi:MAG: LTA synthase family protein [Bdellovibrio sp.]|nr:LTA synthase family protein [Bdellovibrio sp.]